MATPQARRSWSVTLPTVPWAAVLAAAILAGFAVGAAVPGGFDRLELTRSGLSARPWTILAYPFAHDRLLAMLLDLAAVLCLAPGLERSGGAVRLVAWFGAGTLAGAALALLSPSAPLSGATPALLGVAVGLATRRSDPAARAPLGAVGRWLGLALAIAASLPSLVAVGGVVRLASIGGLVLTGLVLARTRKPAIERRVEQPNSHFDMPVSQPDQPSSTPWDDLDLGALHEVNRAEVLVLLRRAHELGPSYLSPTDRELLDRMALAARPWERGLGHSDPR